jgi:hypothetical protein
MNKENLIAACGLYCGACEMYRAVQDNNQQKCEALLKQFNSRGGNFTLDDITCDGCLGGGKLTPWCRECGMRNCAKHKNGETRCTPECPDFPCAQLTGFSTDQMTHHHEVLDNLDCLHKVGIKKHAEQEEKRWLCPECKTHLSWYDTKCPKCGKERSKKLYKVPENWLK